MLLTTKNMLDGCRAIVDLKLRDELEDPDSDQTLPDDCDSVGDYFNRLYADDQFKLEFVAAIAYIVGRVSEAWGQDVGLVFYHMACQTDDEKEDALHYLLMGCFGHGVGLWDNYSTALEHAGKVLGREFDDAPIHVDDNELLDTIIFRWFVDKGN